MGTPQDSGGGKVDSGCIHNGNREGLSGDHEMHEQHVGFHVSDLVTLGQENGCSAPRKLFFIDRAVALSLSIIITTNEHLFYHRCDEFFASG